MKDIGTWAFYKCNNLAKITFPDGLETIGAGCFSESGLKEVVIPSNVTVIGKNAFKESKNLKKISFQGGSKLEKIGSDCFSGTGIEEFLAPSSLREIGSNAFYNCKNLERITLNEGLEKLEGYMDYVLSSFGDPSDRDDWYKQYTGVF